MHILDIIIFCIIGLLVFNGIRKGFIISLASLIALGLGIYAAVHFSNYVEKILVSNLHPGGTWLPILSFALTFIIVVIIVMVIAKAMEKMISLIGMGILNRIFGGIFGFIKGVLIVSVLLFIIVSIDKKEKLITRKAKQESMVYPYVAKAFPFMIKALGGEIKFTDFKADNFFKS
jgi:membrane protein required for colicin V production